MQSPSANCTSQIHATEVSTVSEIHNVEVTPIIIISSYKHEYNVPSLTHTSQHLSASGKAGIGVATTAGIMLAFSLGFTFFFAKKAKSQRLAKGIEQSHVTILPDCEKYMTNQDTQLPSVESHSSWTDIVLNSWFYEAIAMCFSIACFVTIFCTLMIYNQSRTPEGFYGLTLNTMVSALATASKSSLLYVVGECICQLRWTAFRSSPRALSLSYVQIYDSASRGPWGSLIALLKDRGRSIVTLGSVVIILGLLFDPFVQQILTYPVKNSEPTIDASGDKATVVQSRVITLPMEFLSPGNLLSKAIYAGIWTNNFDIEPKCLSNDCVWPLVPSLELCSKCEDVTSTATLHGCEFSLPNYGFGEPRDIPCNISLPYGDPFVGFLSIKEYDSGEGNITVPARTVWTVDSLSLQEYDALNGSFILPASNISQPVDIPGFQNRLLGKTIAGVKNPLMVFASSEFGDDMIENIVDTIKGASPGSVVKLKQPKVTACVLSPCLRTYNISVTGGQSSVEVAKEDFGEFYLSSVDDSIWMSWKPSLEPLTNWTSGDYPDGDGYTGRVDPEHFAIGDLEAHQYLDHFPFPGSVNVTVFRADPDDLGWALDTTFPDIEQILSQGLESTIMSIAASISKYARDTSHSIVYGATSTRESYVSVHWAWLTFPTVVILLGLALFVATVLLNTHKKASLWKSSVLPLLYHGLENGSLGDREGDYELMSEMESSANVIKVKLGFTDSMNRTMLQRESDILVSSSNLTLTEPLQKSRRTNSSRLTRSNSW